MDLAVFLVHMGQVGKGVQLLEQVLKTVGSDYGRVRQFDLYTHLTNAYRLMGRTEQANESVEKLLALATDGQLDGTLLNRACITASLHFAESGLSKEEPFQAVQITEEPFQAVVDTARRIGDRTGLADGLYHLALIRLHLGCSPGVQCLRDALACLLPPEGRHPTEETPTVQTLLLQVYGTLGELSVPLGGADEAKKQQLHRLGIAASLGARYDQCRALKCLAQLCRAQGDFPASRLYALRQLNIARVGGYVAEVIAAYRLLGKLHLQEGEHPAALENHSLQLETVLEVGRALTRGQEVPYLHNLFALSAPEFEGLLAEVQADIVKAYLQASQFEGAWGVIQQELESVELAMESAASATTTRWFTQTQGHLGQYHRAKGELELAEQYYQLQLEQAEQHGFRGPQAKANRGLAEVYLQQGEFDKALPHGQRDLQLRQELGDHRSTVKAYLEIARIYQGLHQNPKAIEQLRAAQALAQQTGDYLLKCTACTELGSGYEATEELALAGQTFRELYELAKGGKDRSRANQARARFRAVQEKAAGRH
jgi:tetratricopeptide (TPR) repeat protein